MVLELDTERAEALLKAEATAGAASGASGSIGGSGDGSGDTSTSGSGGSGSAGGSGGAGGGGRDGVAPLFQKLADVVGGLRDGTVGQRLLKVLLKVRSCRPAFPLSRFLFLASHPFLASLFFLMINRYLPNDMRQLKVLLKASDVILV